MSEYAVWLYGSRARGNQDCYSDVDVFIAGEPDVDEILNQLESKRSETSVSQYHWKEIESMARYGSLFLWHLRLEGRPLIVSPEGNKHLENLLRTLPPYQRTDRDIRAFAKCVDDILKGTENGSTTTFEMSVIATVLRHSAVLASYLVGCPKFGRIEPFQFVARRWGFPDKTVLEFERIYQFRLYEDGRASIPFEPSERDVRLWASLANDFLICLREEASAYQKRVFAAN